MAWDVFISYASEDMCFVSDLADALKRFDLKVWFDQNELKPGDSIRKSLDQGLAKSQMGIIVIGPTFFQKHWAINELGALFSVRAEFSKRLVPVLYKVDHAFVVKHSPMLADLKTIDASIGALGVARVIASLFYQFNHPIGMNSRTTLFISIDQNLHPQGIDEIMVREFRGSLHEGEIPFIKLRIHRDALSAGTSLPNIIYESINDNLDCYRIIKELHHKEEKSEDERNLCVELKEYRPQMQELEARVSLGINALLTIKGATAWLRGDSEIAQCLRSYVSKCLQPTSDSALKIDARMKVKPFWQIGIHLNESEKNEILRDRDSYYLMLGLNVLDLPHQVIVDKWIPLILYEAFAWKEIKYADKLPEAVFDLTNWVLGLG